MKKSILTAVIIGTMALSGCASVDLADLGAKGAGAAVGAKLCNNGGDIAQVACGVMGAELGSTVLAGARRSRRSQMPTQAEYYNPCQSVAVQDARGMVSMQIMCQDYDGHWNLINID